MNFDDSSSDGEELMVLMYLRHRKKRGRISDNSIARDRMKMLILRYIGSKLYSVWVILCFISGYKLHQVIVQEKMWLFHRFKLSVYCGYHLTIIVWPNCFEFLHLYWRDCVVWQLAPTKNMWLFMQLRVGLFKQP